MITNSGRLVCDCCGRQIVEREVSDTHCVGPKSKSVILGINKHACLECKDDEQSDFERDVARKYGIDALEDL